MLTSARGTAAWHERGLPGCDGADTVDLFSHAHDGMLHPYLSNFDYGAFGNFSALASASGQGTSPHWKEPRRGKQHHAAEDEGMMETMGQMIKYGRVSNIVGGISTVIKGSSDEGAGVKTVQHLRSLVEGGGEQEDEEHQDQRYGQAQQNNKDKVTDIKLQLTRLASRKALQDDKGASMGRSASRKNIKAIVQKKVINPIKVMNAFKIAGMDFASKTASKSAIPVEQDKGGLQAAAGLSWQGGKFGRMGSSNKSVAKTLEASTSAGLQDTTFDGGVRSKAIDESLSLSRQSSSGSTPREKRVDFPGSAARAGPRGNRSPNDLLKDRDKSPMQVLVGKRMSQTLTGTAKHLGEDLRAMDTVRESPEFRPQDLSGAAKGVASLKQVQEFPGVCVASVTVPCDQCGGDIFLRMMELADLGHRPVATPDAAGV